MTHLISCEFNMDTACVELKFTDGSMIAIDGKAGCNAFRCEVYQLQGADSADRSVSGGIYPGCGGDGNTDEEISEVLYHG